MGKQDNEAPNMSFFPINMKRQMKRKAENSLIGFGVYLFYAYVTVIVLWLKGRPLPATSANLLIRGGK